MPINEAGRRALAGLAEEQRRARGMLGRTYASTGTQRDPRGEVEAMAGDQSNRFQVQMDRMRQNYAMARMRQKWQRFQMDEALREQKRRRKAATRQALLGGASALTQLFGRGSQGEDPQGQRRGQLERGIRSSFRFPTGREPRMYEAPAGYGLTP